MPFKCDIQILSASIIFHLHNFTVVDTKKKLDFDNATHTDDVQEASTSAGLDRARESGECGDKNDFSKKRCMRSATKWTVGGGNIFCNLNWHSAYFSKKV